jgi:H+/Cl- antiporter ClcA
MDEQVARLGQQQETISDVSTPPWSLWVVGSIGFLFGPVASALITYFNFKWMGKPDKANWTLGLTLIGVVIYSVILARSSANEAETMGEFLGNAVSPFLYPAIQWGDFKNWELNERETYNGWRSIGWGFLGMIIFLLLSFIVFVFMYAFSSILSS